MTDSTQGTTLPTWNEAVDAYVRGDIKKPVATKVLHQALVSAEPGDMANIVAEIKRLDEVAVTKSTTPSRTATDYAKAYLRRLRDIEASVAFLSQPGTYPSDLPAELRDEFDTLRETLDDPYEPTADKTTLDYGQRSVFKASGRKGSVDQHLAEVADRVEVGDRLTFTEAARENTSFYPDGKLSPGAVAARFAKDGSKSVDGWAYSPAEGSTGAGIVRTA